MNKKNKLAANLAVLPLYIFSLVFVAGPLIYMVILSFEARNGSGFTLDNYKKIFDALYLKTFAESLKLAAVSTAAVTVLGYPFGLCAAFSNGKIGRFYHTAQMIPYFVNSLLRLVGWIIIFRANGLLDKLLMALGIIKEPLKLLYSYPAVVVGMIYVLLPFMFMSVYQVAVGMDKTLVEAARDLGAGRVRSFLSVTLPLTLPGLKTGIILTFIPSMGLFFIASILGGNKVVLLGSLIEEQLMKAHNTPFAAALSTVLMLFTAIVCGLLMKKSRKSKKTE